MRTTWDRIVARLPDFLRGSAEKLNVLRASGLLSDPGALVKQWRHRSAFIKLQKSLFYHRYATAILLAYELGVYDALHQKPSTAVELGETLGIHLRSTDALLRILDSQGIVERIGSEERFRLTRFAEAYLARDGEFTVSPLLDLVAAQALAFSEIPRGMKTGVPPAILDIFSPDGRYGSYLQAVNSYLDVVGRDLLNRVVLPEIRSFIVGSMGVSFSGLIMRRFPSARVTYGCLDHLVREIPGLRNRYDISAERVDGMHVHGGEPGADRWGTESYDLVFLTKKMILDPENRIGEKFAEKAFQVLRPNGVALFWETVHCDRRPTPLAQAMEAVLDLGASPIGTVNTETGIQTLLSSIGFREIDIVRCLDGQTTFVLARKSQ